MCSVEKRGNIFILTLTNNDENDEHRLSPSLIKSIRSAIADIKSQTLSSPESSYALITTATGKFFSNGFDLRWAQSQSGNFQNNLKHMVDSFEPLVSDFLSLPMPTIAAITGHAAAAGFALALSHDYLYMRKDRGVLYMSEIDLGMPFPEYFNVLFKEKLSWTTRREIMLKGRKLKGEQGLELGVIDQVYATSDQVFEAAFTLAQQLVNKKWKGNIYAEIRKGLCPNLCNHLNLTRNTITRWSRTACNRNYPVFWRRGMIWFIETIVLLIQAAKYSFFCVFRIISRCVLWTERHYQTWSLIRTDAVAKPILSCSCLINERNPIVRLR